MQIVTLIFYRGQDLIYRDCPAWRYAYFVFMIPLNLPSFNYNVKNNDGKVLIFDIIRRKYIVLTPEEWVRQHFIHFMIGHLQYPKTLISVETGHKYNTLSKRTDIVVYNRQGKAWLIIECKAPDQPVNEGTLRQVSVYNTRIQATYIAMTNGLTHVCCAVDQDTRETTVMTHFPVYDAAV